MSDEIEKFEKQVDHWACFAAEGPCLDYREENLRSTLRMYARLCFNDPVSNRDPATLWAFFLRTPAYRDFIEMKKATEESS